MPDSLTNLAGWIPAVILPMATLLQLIKIARTKSVEGVSMMAWILFGIANIGLYVFTEKYLAPQALIGMLGTAALNFVIVGMVLHYRRNAETKG